MIRTRSWEAAVKGRIVRDAPEFQGTRVPLIDSDLEASPGPHAFVIEQKPHFVVGAHFHREYQFQLFSAGGGLLGKHAVQPLTIHYSSPESAYGPIVAGSEGLSYYTLRAMQGVGACYMPESRPQMKLGLNKHQVMSGAVRARAPAALRALTAPAIQPCIAASLDGMAGWKLAVPPAATLPARALPGSGARYYFVLGGSLNVDAQALGPGSVAFVCDEADFMIKAGEAGLEVLVLQFPEQALQRH
jgi:hypothetical protein